MPQLCKLINVKNRLRDNSLAFESSITYDSFESFLCCCSKPLKCNYDKPIQEYALPLPSPKIMHFTDDHIVRNFQIQAILFVVYRVIVQRHGWWHFKLPVKVPIPWRHVHIVTLHGLVCLQKQTGLWLVPDGPVTLKKMKILLYQELNKWISFVSSKNRKIT